MNAKLEYWLPLLILLLFRRPAHVSGSPSYEKQMWRLLYDLKVKSISDGCISDDIPNARRTLGQHNLLFRKSALPNTNHIVLDPAREPDRESRLARRPRSKPELFVESELAVQMRSDELARCLVGHVSLKKFVS